MDINYFNPDIGHTDIQAQILTSIKTDRLPHAYLFYGSEGSGKDAFAIELARLLNCQKGPLTACQSCSQCQKIAQLQHPDVQFIFPVPSSSNVKPEEIGAALEEKAKNPYRRITFGSKNSFIGIDTIRELKREAKYKLYEGKRKVFIISEAEQLRPEAANALLKILEEPPGNLMIILITSRIHRILPTIRSRCQLIHFPPLPGDQVLTIIRNHVSNPPEHLARLVRLASDNTKLAFDFVENDVIGKRDQAVDFLRRVALIEKSNDLFQEIEKITASRDRRDMQLLLFFLLTWFRDTVHLQANPSLTDQLTNSDLLPNLKKFVNGYPRALYPQIIQQIELGIKELEDARNLNTSLIFLNLSIKLNQLIKNI